MHWASAVGTVTADYDGDGISRLRIGRLRIQCGFGGYGERGAEQRLPPDLGAADHSGRRIGI